MDLQKQTYQSVTLWQEDLSWEVEVRVGKFFSP